MITCIIAEKPSVARDIARIVGADNKCEGYYQGGDYIVTWAIGHLVTLAMPEAYGYANYKAEYLPICPTEFHLCVRQSRSGKEWINDPSAEKRLETIQECFNLSDRIIVATDAGREGELIFRYIYEYIKCTMPFDRLWISSLTDKAISEGLKKLKSGKEYDNLYYSAQARSQADWLVGINASRAFSIARQGNYSLGRVQTPTLAMVCKRYLENTNFVSTPYWQLNALIEKEEIKIKAVGEKNFDDETSAQKALLSLQQQGRLKVTSLSRKNITINPPLLYDLTSLQKQANNKYGFSAEKTLSLAQSLYEKKLTTYPRTGSRYISEDIFEQIENTLQALNVNIANPLNRHSVDNNKVTDHHAIIPTGEKDFNISTDGSTYMK